MEEQNLYLIELLLISLAVTRSSLFMESNRKTMNKCILYINIYIFLLETAATVFRSSTRSQDHLCSLWMYEARHHQHHQHHPMTKHALDFYRYPFRGYTRYGSTSFTGMDSPNIG